MFMDLVAAPPVAQNELDTAFLGFVEELCGATTAPAGQWAIRQDPDQPWIRVIPAQANLPEQGWKLHLSAGLSSAEAVLRQALPVLFAEHVQFKVAGSLRALARLNDGHNGMSQVGKFITVYPTDDSQAVRV